MAQVSLGSGMDPQLVLDYKKSYIQLANRQFSETTVDAYKKVRDQSKQDFRVTYRLPVQPHGCYPLGRSFRKSKPCGYHQNKLGFRHFPVIQIEQYTPSIG
jgi:hypothetical protein